MKPLPSSVTSYRRTAEFTEATVPPGLLRRHRTRRGVWGQIHVLEGSLRYRILEPRAEEHLLQPRKPGIVEPEVAHQVEISGPVRFFVEFFR